MKRKSSTHEVEPDLKRRKRTFHVGQQVEYILKNGDEGWGVITAAHKNSVTVTQELDLTTSMKIPNNLISAIAVRSELEKLLENCFWTRKIAKPLSSTIVSFLETHSPINLQANWEVRGMVTEPEEKLMVYVYGMKIKQTRNYLSGNYTAFDKNWALSGHLSGSCLLLHQWELPEYGNKTWINTCLCKVDPSGELNGRWYGHYVDQVWPRTSGHCVLKKTNNDVEVEEKVFVVMQIDPDSIQPQQLSTPSTTHPELLVTSSGNEACS